MVYQWKTIKYRVDAQVAGEEVERIANTRPLTPNAIVQESRAETSPLHIIFEWDNERAGDEWRKQQARVMLGNLVTVKVNNVKLQEVTRAFVNVTQGEEKYTSISVVANNRKMLEVLVARATAELASFRRKYQGIQEIEEHFGKLKEVEDAIQKAV